MEPLERIWVQARVTRYSEWLATEGQTANVRAIRVHFWELHEEILEPMSDAYNRAGWPIGPTGLPETPRDLWRDSVRRWSCCNCKMVFEESERPRAGYSFVCGHYGCSHDICIECWDSGWQECLHHGPMTTE